MSDQKAKAKAKQVKEVKKRVKMPSSPKELKNWAEGYTGQKYITTVVFLLVPVVLLIVFTAIPAVQMLIFSFQSRDIFGINPKWVGTANYKTIFTDAMYISTLKTSLYYIAGSFVQLSLALLIAQTLCTKIKLKNLFKGVIFFPYMMNGIAVALIFRRFFQKGDGITNTEGTFNSILGMLGMEAKRWFMDSPVIANFCLVFASIWRYIGFDIIMFIAAITAISAEVLEASEIDGATSWQKFKYITFPGIRPIIALQLILSIKGAVSVFEIPYVITLGKFGTNTFVIQTMSTAFESKKVGLGCAMGIVLLVIIIIVTLIQKAFFKEET